MFPIIGEILSDIADRIKELRKIVGVSQEVFVSSIGITRSHLSKIETRQANPSKRLIKSITREYPVSEEWLREGKGDPINKPIALQSDLLKIDNDNQMDKPLHEHTDNFKMELEVVSKPSVQDRINKYNFVISQQKYKNLESRLDNCDLLLNQLVKALKDIRSKFIELRTEDYEYFKNNTKQP
ncbi:MAG: helix-turn-helix transcriptional regulator [Desulfobacterales bacterium]|nr:helix-turn-helix transcriptional regulator [Desulfobacterales bacterium]